MDELIDGVVGDAGFVFDIGIDDFTNLVFGDDLAGAGLE